MVIRLGCTCRYGTWKSVKCMRKRTQSGRLNQKNLLLGSTTGAPLMTVARSWISCAISMIMISSLVPTHSRI